MSNENSNDVIFLLNNSGDLEKVPVQPYDSEDLLQTLIEKYPELLAGDQINPDDPVRWLLVKREAGVPDGDQQNDRWSIDHLLLDQDSIPTFVETKRSSDTRIRREVIGQMFDYAANSQRYWPVDRIRSMTIEQSGGTDASDRLILKLLDIEPSESSQAQIETFWKKVEENLHDGRIRLVFVADKLPPELRRVIEFLNDQMDRTEVLGLELTQYVGSDFKALVPRLMGQTEVTRQNKQAAAPNRKLSSQEEILERFPPFSRDFLKQTFAEAENHKMQVNPGTSGFSLKAFDSGGKPVSIVFGLPKGSFRQDYDVIQGYVGYFAEQDYRDKVYKRFGAIPGTSKSGDYTINVNLTEKTLDSAKKLMEAVWETNAEISKMDLKLRR